MVNHFSNIDNILSDIMKVKCNNMNKKLNKLKEDNKIHTQYSKHVFHKRIENMSNVEFTGEGKTLLSKGLKYNLHHKQKHWIKTLAIEADSAINLLNPHEQAYMRQRVTHRLRRLIDNDTRREMHNTHTRQS
jgi:hypothetical protein